MPSKIHHRVEASGLDCAVCGHDGVVAIGERSVECPNCEESYSLVLRDGFALLESDGWIARVAFDPLEDAPGAVPG